MIAFRCSLHPPTLTHGFFHIGTVGTQETRKRIGLTTKEDCIHFSCSLDYNLLGKLISEWWYAHWLISRRVYGPRHFHNRSTSKD
ncbi:tripartite motif-containing protein 16 [Sarotherodon galilaeus]